MLRPVVEFLALVRAQKAGFRSEIRLHRERQRIGPVVQNGFNAGIKMSPRHWDVVSLVVGIAGHPPGFPDMPLRGEIPG